uniref:C-type lectin domain family 4 member K-like n=1 Tax=Danio rerio TaxID=7955 RepID=E7F2R6_DANRE|nr:C-type lectin domain family 4 member K-like [Danio rerio]|eukprot:XP_005155331.2 C-type lectin domain family 4 member K-like [Danio rerio]
MHRKNRENTGDIYENHGIREQSGHWFTDCNTTRIQTSELKGTAHKCDDENIKKATTWRIQKGGRQTTDDIYENDVIGCISGEEINDNTMRIQSSELTGNDLERMKSFRAALVCLILLCVLLLTAVLVLSVFIYTNSINYTEERRQLLTNITEDRAKLLTNITNLTEKSNQLLQNNTNLLNETDQLKWKKENLLNQLKKILTGDGWTYNQSSFYYKSNISKTWIVSRSDCIARGADLIIINNQQEQDFVMRKSNVAAVWIGLNDIIVEGTWRWVDGSAMKNDLSFWASGSNEPNGDTNENCVVSADKVTEWPYTSGWSDVSCERTFQWICEKNISQLI